MNWVWGWFFLVILEEEWSKFVDIGEEIDRVDVLVRLIFFDFVYLVESV